MQESLRQQSVSTPNMNQSIPVKCAQCEKQSNQLLGLVCGHDVCLQCASKSYFADHLSQQKQHKSGVMEISNSIFWCQICYEATIIQKTSIDMMKDYLRKNSNKKERNSLERQFMKLAASQQAKNHYQSKRKQKNREKSKNKQHQKELRSRSSSKFSIQKDAIRKYGSGSKAHHMYSPEKANLYQKQKQFFDDYLQLVKSHQILSGHTLGDSERTKQVSYKRKNSQKLVTSHKSSSKSPYYTNREAQVIHRFPCGVHQDEQIAYFCYHCEKSLCPQCAINGPHKSHQVLSLKRHPNKLQNLFEEIISQTNKHRHKLERYLKQIEEWIESSMNLLLHNEQVIKDKFQSLHSILVQKQEQLLRDLKAKYEQQIHRIKKQSKQIHDVAKHAKRSQKIIQQIFKEDHKSWDIFELQKQKEILETLNNQRFKESFNDFKVPSIKNIKIGLITEAIDLIEQLVAKFKLQVENPSRQ